MTQKHIALLHWYVVLCATSCGEDSGPGPDTTSSALAPPPAVADTGGALKPAIVVPDRFEGYPLDVIAAYKERGLQVVLRAKISVPTTEKMRDEVRSVIVKRQPWPAARVTVAFNGGNPTLWQSIADAASVWTDSINLQIDFWTDASKKRFRTWTENDLVYSADIRISFSGASNWSVIGREAISLRGPAQASMNLARFTGAVLPTNWRTTTIHEFGHALGFQHEHQSPKANCILEYRWKDERYVGTTADDGSWGIDSNGNYPGVYTYLGGAPNQWPAPMVDFNLRELPFDRGEEYDTSPYDPKSIMHYAFVPWLFVNKEQSKCYKPLGSISTLSAEDRRGAAKAYPKFLSEKTTFQMRTDSAVVRQLAKTFNGGDVAKLGAAIKAMRVKQ